MAKQLSSDGSSSASIKEAMDYSDEKEGTHCTNGEYLHDIRISGAYDDKKSQTV